MSGIYVLVIYLVLAVFWGFVPQAILAAQWPAAIMQVLCIGAVIAGTWRFLTSRRFTLDHRIGLAFVAYIVSTASTNVIWWMLQRGAR
jgi:hypothetical protein